MQEDQESGPLRCVAQSQGRASADMAGGGRRAEALGERGWVGVGAALFTQNAKAHLDSYAGS